MPTRTQLVQQSFDRFFEGKFADAAHLFLQARRAPPTSSARESDDVLAGWCSISKGMGEASSLFLDAERAIPHLQRACELLHDAPDADGHAHARCLLALFNGGVSQVRGRFALAEHHFDDTVRFGEYVVDHRAEHRELFSDIVGMARVWRGVVRAIVAVEERRYEEAEVELSAAVARAETSRKSISKGMKLKNTMPYVAVGVRLREAMARLHEHDFVGSRNALERAERAAHASEEFNESPFAPAVSGFREHLLAVECAFAGRVLDGLSHAERATNSYSSTRDAVDSHYRAAIEILFPVKRELVSIRALGDYLRTRVHPQLVALNAHIELDGAGLSVEDARDIAELHRAYAIEAWRTVLILTGALVERILLREVAEDRRSGDHTGKNPRDMSLNELVEEATKRGIVSRSIRLGLDSVREHRNLVHPAVEGKRALKSDRATADSAIGALWRLVEDLSAGRKLPDCT